MPLTKEQLAKVKAIVARRHAAVVLRVAGSAALTPDERAILREAGIDPDAADTEDLVRQAYVYGQVRAAAMAAQPGRGVGTKAPPKATTWTTEEFEDQLTLDPVTLSEREERAAEWAEVNAAQHVRGLGMRVDLDTGHAVITADRELEEERRAGIRNATARAIRERKSVADLKSDLGWQAKDWSRDFDRIAVTELQRAHLEGQADAYRAEGDPWVFKQPRPDACKDCKAHYLGPDGMPRLFRLSELSGLGSNVGRKKGAWAPSLEPLHPHCRCVLVRMPDGWGFNEDGDMIPGGKLGLKYGEDEEEITAGRTDETRPRAERGGEELEREGLAKSMAAGDRIVVAGMTFMVEVPKGGVRSWTNREGVSGETKMLWPYGFIEGTLGPDGDEYDAYLGPMPKVPIVYVVHQLIPGTKTWDEDKAFLGFATAAAAAEAYLAHRNDGTAAFGGLTVLPIDDFKRRVFRTPETGGSLTKSLGLEGLEAAAFGRYGNRDPRARSPAENLTEGSPPPRPPKIIFRPPAVRRMADLDNPKWSPQTPKKRPIVGKVEHKKRRIRHRSLKALVDTARATQEIADANTGRLKREARRKARETRNLSPAGAEPDKHL